MGLTSIGDMAQVFVTRRHNSLLKQRLNALTNEMSSGEVQDKGRHLGGDRSRLAALDRGLAMLDGFKVVTTETSQMLDAMQAAIDRIDKARGALGGQLLMASQSATATSRDHAVGEARATFQMMVQTLNTRVADRSVFAGTRTDMPALAESDTMLTDMASAATAAGVSDAGSLKSFLDTWFGPGGGFETTGYQGDATGYLGRMAAEGESVRLEARADDPAFRKLLSATATVALAGALGIGGDDLSSAIRSSAEELMTGTRGLSLMQGNLGFAQNRIEEISVRHSAERAAWTEMRNDLVGIDPFDTAVSLQEVQVQLETHYTLTARLASLSLVSYLR